MTQDYNSAETNKAFDAALGYCLHYRNEFITPEHLLLALTDQNNFCQTFAKLGGDADVLRQQVFGAVKSMERVPDDVPYDPQPSKMFHDIVTEAEKCAKDLGSDRLQVGHITGILAKQEKLDAAYFLRRQLGEKTVHFLVKLSDVYKYKSTLTSIFDDDEQQEDWRDLVTCVSETWKNHNPLIGRETELERTIQVLCRKEKNNPLHVGEPGVGKTSLVYGLAARIACGEVPVRLVGCRIYEMDMGAMIAGTQYRGELEGRIKQVMEGVQGEGKAIIYIDEIHNLVGAGRTGESSMDVSNMLKPYLERGDVRFIGSTTYAEYNRYFAKSAGVVRRFQQIDIGEPSVEEAIGILKGLQKKYESFHHVRYTPEAIDYAVRASAKFINDRFLPDKAIDLIDEAGAFRELHPLEGHEQEVDKQLVADVLAKVCKVQAAAMKEEGNEALATLQSRIKEKVFGQDEAVQQVVRAVQMAKAGLTEENKPLASLLFVGPTGVGKTEVARVLAQELGIELVRFDMSEYTEKHAVAKLIGAPAGYVGYEDGGLLTDAIRKSPNCILLLDEIEKAHTDIYNILLQVMDYARLTDNKGQKADFRNVVLILTSNAGAQYAAQASVGFNGNISRGEAMLAQVKKTFKPEFINRLSAMVVFHDMSRAMAQLILQKKLAALHAQLAARQVQLTLTAEAEKHLLSLGFTPQSGAREMDRVIASQLKPLLTREMLFGKLKNGGRAEVSKSPNSPGEEGDANSSELVLEVLPRLSTDVSPQNGRERL